MTREEFRMKLWCDALLEAAKKGSTKPPATFAEEAVQAFDQAFPPQEQDTRFDRLVQWIWDNANKNGIELIINTHEFDRALKEI